MGVEAAEQRAQLLEADREHRVNAWRVRLALHLNLGNAEEAKKCMRRAELLQLQEGSQQRYLGTSAGFELMAQALIGDLIGVKRAVDNVTELAQHYPGWRPALLLGLCEYRKLQGDLPGALDAIESALPLTPAGRHPYYPQIAAAHVSVLRALGRVQDAISWGRSYAQLCRELKLEALDRWVHLELAIALAQGGEYAQALALLDSVIAVCERLHMGGLSLGAVYEARARIAIWMNDGDAFARYSELCAVEYKKGRNPALVAKFARLMDEARQSEPQASVPPRAAAELLELSQTETGLETIQSRMLECVDEGDRARCALTILLQSSDSFAGYLFGVRDEALVPLAGLPEVTADDGLARWLRDCLKAEIESQASATATADGEDEAPSGEPSMRYTDGDGRCFEPIFLVGKREHEQRIAAVLAMQIAPGPRTIPPKELLAEIADQLFDHGDVTGIAI
jgi:tetratricopeptide (TPR) repeat protein